MLVDMVKTLSPRLHAFLLDLYDLLTKPTPESSLTITPNSAFLKLGLQNVLVRELVVFLEVAPEDFSAVADFLAIPFVTSPHFQHEMLRIFMTLPIILAPKLLIAVWHGAAVRLLMSFLVLSNIWISIAHRMMKR